MPFWAALAVDVGVYIASRLMRKYGAHAEVDGPKASDVQMPTVDADARRRLVYGRVLVRDPQILAYGDAGVRTDIDPVNDHRDDETTRWFASVHYGICTTNVIIDNDQGNYPQLLGIWIGGRRQYWMTRARANHITSQSGNGDPIWYYKQGPLESLISYGHNDEVEEYSGEVDFTRGRPNEGVGTSYVDDGAQELGGNEPYRQVMMFYRRLKAGGNGADYDPTGSEVPFYRNMATALLTNPPPIEGQPWRGFYYGMSPRLPGVWFEVINPVAVPGIDPQLMEINGGDANPVGVLYDLLVNTENGRLGLDPSLIDIDNFREIAQKLYDEQHGYSREFSEETEIGNIVKDIERQIDGHLIEDPETGKIKIVLVREDYDINTLPLLKDYSTPGSPANICENGVAGYVTAGWDTVANTVRARFYARESEVQTVVGTPPNTQTISQHDLYYDWRIAEAMSQGGVARDGSMEPLRIDYAGVSNAELAARIATRDLRVASLPLDRLTLKVSRFAFNYYKGMVVRARHAHWGGVTRVFRVLEVDLGEYGSNVVTLEMMIDRWAVGYTAHDALPIQPVTAVDANVASIPENAITEEAPRFWLQLAERLGQINSADSQRLWYLIEPKGINTHYRGRIAVNPAGNLPQAFSFDTGVVPNNGTFEVDADYPRTTDTYDTTVGLRIRALNGWTPIAASDHDIRRHGANVLYLNGELLAYSSFTDEGDGVYTLHNIRRELGGTAPFDHAEGDLGYTIDKITVKAIGRSGLLLDDRAVTRVQGLSGTLVSPSEPALFEGDLNVRMRTLLPLAPVDVKIAANTSLDAYLTPVKAPVDMITEGVGLTYKSRSRLANELRRGDDAVEAPAEADTVFDVVVIRDDDDEVIVAHEGITDLDSVSEVSLALAGWGPWHVGIRARLPVTIGGVSSEYLSWQTPAMPIYAHTFRNLLMSFVNMGSQWEAVAGTKEPNLDNRMWEWFLKDSSGTGTLTVRQDADLSQWTAHGLRALLKFITWSDAGGDTNDTVGVDLIQLDEDGTTLVTSSYGPATQTTTKQPREIDVSACDTGMRSLRVQLTEQAVTSDDPDVTTNAVGTVFNLEVGQFTDELLINPNFESGTTSWTVSAGSFTDSTSTPLTGTHHVTGGSSATNSISQECAIPAGFQNARAVLRVHAIHPGGSATLRADLLVEALDGLGGAVVASGTASLTLVITERWLPMLAHCDVPLGATHIRVTLSGVRVAGSGNGVGFDYASLRVHKYLSPSDERSYEMTPAVQHRPESLVQWSLLYPDVPPPRDLLLIPGTGSGIQGTQPPIEIRGASHANGFLHGLVAADGSSSIAAWEFRRGVTSGLRIRQPGLGAKHATQSFAVRIVYDLRELVNDPTCALACRYDATQGLGWYLGLDADGSVVAKLFGEDATITATLANQDQYGPGVTQAWLIYDSDAETLTVAGRTSYITTSTVGMGDIWPSFTLLVDGVFVGCDPNTSSAHSPSGLVASVEMWNEAVSVTDALSVWTHGRNETNIGSLLEDGLTEANASVATVIDDVLNEGVRVMYAGNGQHVHARPWGTWGAPGGTGRTNLVNPRMSDPTGWTASGGATVVRRFTRGPDGSFDAVKLTGTNADYYAHTFAMGAGDVTNVTFFLRLSSSTAKPMIVQLEDTDGVVIDSGIRGSLDTWQRIDVQLNGWTGSTPNAVLKFIPTIAAAAQTIYIAGPFFVDKDANPSPIAIPVWGSAKIHHTYEALGLPARFNHEGEIELDVRASRAAPGSGTLFDMRNSGDEHDRRRFYLDGEDPVLAFYDGVGAGTNLGPGSTPDWSVDQKVRARWQRAGLLESPGDKAGIMIGTDAGYGMAGGWTPGAAGLDVFGLLHDGTEGADEELDVLVYRVAFRWRETIF